MAPARRSDKGAVTPIPQETCVVVGLEFGGCTREDLINWAIVIQEVVDAKAGSAAPEAAVRCVYEPPAVEIIFTVENETPAGVHKRVAQVLGAIQRVVPRAFNTETATRSSDLRELVPA